MMKTRQSFVTVLAAVLLISCATWAQEVERITDGPRVKRTTETSAEIAWSTTAAGSSIVHYGTRPRELSEIAQQPWGGTHEPNGDFNHTVWVSNLRPNTRYFFVVVTGQGRDTGTRAMSRVQQFRTGPGR